ncbi:major facilitator superfamily transporter (plasmid) [Leptolyngbya sp. NIES-3755]|nr:major facilitator superfamily transporter [Leptolyngbya sp. NIES-3755]
MKSEQQPSMRTFRTLWMSQIVSLLGSEMTTFALTIWVWEQTGQASPIALMVFFTRSPQVIAAAFAGVLVDTWDRKQLMLLGDLVAGLSTIGLLSLFLTQHLQVWHLYAIGAANGLFSYLQSLAHSASMAVLVPKQHYARASAMETIKSSSAYVFSPALAGMLYPSIGLIGILAIDLATFVIAVSTLLMIPIPQPTPDMAAGQTPLQTLTFGFRYIWQRSGLLSILLFLLSSNLFFSANFALTPALILARSGNSASTLATVQSVFGIGGLMGAILLSLWGGTTPRIHGLLLGAALSRVGLLLLSVGRGLTIWVIAAWITAFFVPFVGSANQAIWLAKVEPEVQGRVFAARYLIAQAASPLGFAIAGPLADYVFEPAMLPDGRLAGLLGGLFGTGAGAGIALQYALLAVCGFAIGLGGYGIHRLRDVETLIPDHDAAIG